MSRAGGDSSDSSRHAPGICGRLTVSEALSPLLAHAVLSPALLVDSVELGHSTPDPGLQVHVQISLRFWCHLSGVTPRGSLGCLGLGELWETTSRLEGSAP